MAFATFYNHQSAVTALHALNVRLCSLDSSMFASDFFSVVELSRICLFFFCMLHSISPASYVIRNLISIVKF